LPISTTTNAIKLLWGIDLLKSLTGSSIALWAAEDPT
jgi:hypothetical protein